MPEFTSEGGGIGSGVIPIIPPNTLMPSPPFVVRFCAESRGNKLLAVADEEGAVHIVDAAARLPAQTGTHTLDAHDWQPEHQWNAHDNAVFDLAWADGDRRMLTASGDQTVRLWDIETAVVHCGFRRHTGGGGSVHTTNTPA